MSSFFECFNNFVQNGRPTTVSVVSNRRISETTPTPSESSSTISVPSESSFGDKMEHSYMREPNRPDSSNGLAPTRTILVRHPPQCLSCQTYSAQEQSDSNDINESQVPAYDEISAKEAMNECARIAKYVRNNNSDDQDWEMRVNQIGWSAVQKSLFDKVVQILDQDQLARLANEKRQNESIHRRISVDKSTSRMRRTLANIAWEPRLTQWLHMLLMESLPPSYMASYLDIMQALKTRLPTLTDRMLFSRPLNNSQELLAPVMKKKWDPAIITKSKHLVHNAVIVMLPNMPLGGQMSDRMQKWCKALSSITQIVQITLPNSSDRVGRLNFDQLAETIVSLTRVRIHELRSEDPSRGIILIGFNAGSALALQVAMSESVACIICMGFAYNTLRGPRGGPDDRLLDIKAPILFVVGQNSARTSQEEMESLRERMQSESSLVIVGSADDSLRVPKSKRRIEGVTQTMVNAMVVDEIFDFVNKTLTNPPGARMPSSLFTSANYKPKNVLSDGNVNKGLGQSRKRKADAAATEDDSMASKSKFVPHKARVLKVPKPRLIDPFAAKRKVGRPRTRPLPSVPANANKTVTSLGQSNEELNSTMESMLDDTIEFDGDVANNNSFISTTGVKTFASVQKAPGLSNLIPVVAANTSKAPVALTPGTKIKMIPSNQFVHLKTLPTQSKIIRQGAINVTKAFTPATNKPQIITLKTSSNQTTQLTAGVAANQKQKFTVIKNINGSPALQLAKSLNTQTTISTGVTSPMDFSNIIDMPIVFADSDGNIAEHQQKLKPDPVKSTPVSSSNVGQLIISQKIIKEANPQVIQANTLASGSNILTSSAAVNTVKAPTIMLNKGLHQLLTTQNAAGGSNSPTVGNKVVLLNRNNLRSVTSMGTTRVSSGSPSSLPFTKVILSNAKGAGNATTSNQPLVLDSNINAMLQNVKTVTNPPLKSNVGTSAISKNYTQFQVINSGTSSSGIAVSEGKQPIRNIYFKSATGLKQVPVQMLANRPITVTAGNTATGIVRRVVNVSSSNNQAQQSPTKIVKLLTPTTSTLSKTPE